MSINNRANPATPEQEAKRAAKAADGRRDTRLKNEQDGLAEPPRPLPLENSGLSGLKLQEEISKYRQELEEKAQRQLKPEKGAVPLQLKTLKDTIIEAIQASHESLNTKQAAAELHQRPLSELHPFLPRFDWRDYRVVPAVRDQFNSPRCWAYTATEVYESSLMIQRANFAMNDERRMSNIFRVDNIELNARNTFECLENGDPESGGRFEAAFNFYIKRGIPARDIKLIQGLPVTDAPGVALSGDDIVLVNAGLPDPQPLSLAEASAPLSAPMAQAERDGSLPEGHCKERTKRIKARGWDYVRDKKPWKIPTQGMLKKALLEHGPLAVGVNIKGKRQTLFSYGHQKIDGYCVEVGRNERTGMVFREDPFTYGLFVRLPRKAFRAVLKEPFLDETSDEFRFHQPDTYRNLNLTRDELMLDWAGETANRYQILGAAAQCFRQGRHQRKARNDRDVGIFYDRETNEFIWHFPTSNEVRLAIDSATGEPYLNFPANTEAVFTPTAGEELLIKLPALKDFEDLTPVFVASRNADMNHYVVLTGWDDRKRAWIVLNSWGKQWGFRCHPQRGTRGYGYIAYGTFGQFAAWLEAPLLEEKLWRAES